MKEVKVEMKHTTPSEGTLNEGLTLKKGEVQVDLKAEVLDEAAIEGLAKKFNLNPREGEAKRREPTKQTT